MVICNFLKATWDAIWQPCSMIILSLSNFFSGQERLDTSDKESSSRYLLEAPTHQLTERRTGEGDDSIKKKTHSYSEAEESDGSGKWLFTVILSRPGSCPVQQARCESTLFTRGFLLCKDFLQDRSLKLSCYQSWRGNAEPKTTLH